VPGWLGRGSIPLAGLVVPFVKRMVKPHPSIHMNNESNNKPSDEGPYLYVKHGAIHLGISEEALKKRINALKQPDGWRQKQ
jgi:hypothetical protein